MLANHDVLQNKSRFFRAFSAIALFPAYLGLAAQDFGELSRVAKISSALRA
jgi:hypothetical protein